jgi:hypothetical protein
MYLALVLSLAGISAGVIVGAEITKLSQDALALGMGLAGGCLIGLVPVGIMIAVFVVAVRWFDARESRRAARISAAAPQSPVVIVAGQPGPWQMPQQMTMQQPAALPEPWSTAPAQRVFTVIGEDE